MAAGPYDLITIAELRDDYLHLTGSGSDTQLQGAITRASAIIERTLCRDLITRGTLIEYHTLGSERQKPHELYLLEWPIIAVASVYEDSTRAYAATELLAADVDYIVSKSAGKLLRLSSSTGGPAWWNGDFRAVKVTYTAGYATGGATVPQPIKDVALELSALIWRQGERGIGGIGVAGEVTSGTWNRIMPATLTDAMRATLAPWKRLEFATTGERDA